MERTIYILQTKYCLQTTINKRLSMYMPIWILYWFPFFLLVNYIIKFIAVNIVLCICKKVIKINEIYSITVVIKSLCFAIMSELVGIAMLYIIEMNTESDFYYGNYLLFCLLAFLCTVILSFVLNNVFTFRRINVSTKQKLILASSIVTVTAPYLFLLPSGFVY